MCKEITPCQCHLRARNYRLWSKIPCLGGNVKLWPFRLLLRFIPKELIAEAVKEDNS